MAGLTNDEKNAMDTNMNPVATRVKLGTRVANLENRIKAVTVNVAVGQTSGASAADPDCVGGKVVGVVPAGNQDQFIDNVAIGEDGAVTVTLAAAATAENNFKVNVEKAI